MPGVSVSVVVAVPVVVTAAAGRAHRLHHPDRQGDLFDVIGKARHDRRGGRLVVLVAGHRQQLFEHHLAQRIDDVAADVVHAIAAHENCHHPDDKNQNYRYRY